MRSAEIESSAAFGAVCPSMTADIRTMRELYFKNVRIMAQL
jgi:hypothetical protein